MKSILVVDDEPRVTRVTKLGLERAGYRVELASNGEEALRKLHEGSFDAVVTDVVMPRMTGRELCEQIEAQFPRRKFFIFVVSSSPEADAQSWHRDLPRSEFIEKPLSIRHLVSRLHHHLGGGPSEEGGRR